MKTTFFIDGGYDDDNSTNQYSMYSPDENATNDAFYCRRVFANCTNNALRDVNLVKPDRCSKRWLNCINQRGLVLDRVAVVENFQSNIRANKYNIGYRKLLFLIILLVSFFINI